MKTFSTMLKTEMKLSLRGLDMFIFAICMPVAAILVLGMIYGTKPAFEGAGYTFMAMSFGAVSSIAICAGGVMGLPLLVSDYRHKKILKRFKVTPVSPALILGVQLTIYALYSLASLLLVYAAAALFFGYRMPGPPLPFLGSYFLVMVSMFSIGMTVGGIARDTKIAGVIASLLYFPMLLFSGSTIPYEILPKALQNISDVMPLTQGIKLLKATSLGLPVDGVFVPIAVIVGVAVICTAISLKFFRWE